MTSVGSTRRDFLKGSIAFGGGILAAGSVSQVLLRAGISARRMKFGFVTYLWGQDWDLPTLIANCRKTGVGGVELRTEHAHGVEAGLSDDQRREVKARFADSGIVLVGLGTNFDFHHPDSGRLAKNIAGTREYIKLSHDCGGLGVKVKPNDLPKGVPYEKTIEQIGKSLNELAQFATEYDQKLRLEVHGGGSLLPAIKAILDVATHPNLGICWNCNSQDLEGEGLPYNFNLVRKRFGDTVHVRELNLNDYPYQQLIDLLVATNHDGWVLLEARTDPNDRVKALGEQRELFEQMVARAQSSATDGTGVKIIEHGNKVTVEIDGRPFTEYCFKDVIRPYFHPVIGPTGVPVIRHWPIKDGVLDEDHDHPHHKSLWYAHGAVNGIDFWTDGKGTIVHDKFLQIDSGPQVGVIQSQNNWIAPDGKVICTDTRTHRFYARPEGTLMDFEVTIHASNGPVTMGDTKEGSMAIRLAPTMQVKGKVAGGHIINSEGNTDANAWGQRATWCDCYGPINDQVVGVAIFDHPSNPRHPTWWHVRDYGLFAANPFGVHDFESKPPGTGDLVIPAGGSATFKYRFYFHKGDEKQARVADLYQQYVAGSKQDNR